MRKAHDVSEAMTIGIPPDMRRTALVSLAGHLLVLVALTTVPFMKPRASDMGSYQVLLISPTVTRSSVPLPAVPTHQAAKAVPVPPSKKQTLPPVKTTKLEREAVRAPAPVPVKQSVEAPVPMIKPQERLTDLLHKNMQEVSIPKEVSTASAQPTQTSSTVHKLSEFQRPDVPVEPTPPQPATLQVPQPESVPVRPDPKLTEALKKLDESLNRPTAPVPVLRAPAAKPGSRTSDEVKRELNQLSVPQGLRPMAPAARETPKTDAPPPRPSFLEEINRMLAAAPVQPSAMQPPVQKREPAREVATAAPTLGSATRATLERCPAKAKEYCPLFQRAIDRLWNADSNPAIRQVLESAGDSSAMILIEIRPDGMIQNIAIQESSGNKGYDLAIQSLLRDQQRFPPLPPELKNENFRALTSFRYTRRT
jgi:TonB family protein